MKTFQVDTANQGALLIPVEMPQPEPGPDEVLVRVHAAGVTPTELLWYPTTHTKEGAARTGVVPGHEFSGVVAALGANVHTFDVGDEIYGMNDWFADGAMAGRSAIDRHQRSGCRWHRADGASLPPKVPGRNRSRRL